MTQPVPVRPESDLLPPEPAGAFSVPPPVPQKKPGFLRRLFTSRKKQQAVAIQNGYLEMVDLIRAIRSHLDRQESVQTSLLGMLEKVPEVMESQHQVMTTFKQQLENNMENDRRLTDSMGRLNNTLSGIDESQKASSRTITDLIHRSRESEQLLREVMRRAERRMTLLLVVFFLLVIGMGVAFVRGQRRAEKVPAKSAAVVPAVASEKAVVAELATDKTPEAAPVNRPRAKGKSKIKTAPPADAVGQPDLTLEQLKPAVAGVVSDAQTPSDKPVSVP
jgi:hypothetical protein